MEYRIAQEKNEIKQRLAGRVVYQPQEQYEVGDELVFPALNFAYGTVNDVREGSNPEAGKFTVLAVEVDGKEREFAAGYPLDHVLNQEENTIFEAMDMISATDLHTLYGRAVAEKVAAELEEREGFVRLGHQWFLKGLLADITVGHLNLAEAVLEVSDGGPLPPQEILPHLELEEEAPLETQAFSLNQAMQKDNRFDEVAPAGEVGWFLRRMEPAAVREVPERLLYEPVSFEERVLTPELKLLIRELDDEWSDLEAGNTPQPIVGWVVQQYRYVYGLEDWYAENEIPIGGFISLRPGPEAGMLLLNYDRRRGQREWVRLASVEENRIEFELERRTIACGYDDLLIVGTDFVAAVDALWRRVTSNNRSIEWILRQLFPELAELNPQQTVHAKTLYSAFQMLRRMPPGPIFAELVQNADFVPVGDHYWQYKPSRG
jgi:hypothetical protein